MSETYHQRLREKYSRILQERLSNDEIISQLSDKDIELLFNELRKWFGTSPPETSRVKSGLKEIIQQKIDSDVIELGD